MASTTANLEAQAVAVLGMLAGKRSAVGVVKAGEMVNHQERLGGRSCVLHNGDLSKNSGCGWLPPWWGHAWEGGG